MGEKVTDHDFSFPVRVKLLPVFSDGVIKTHSPGFDELHERCRRRNNLGKGCNVENGIRGHRHPFRLKCSQAQSATIENLFPVPNQNNGSWNLACSNRSLGTFFNGCYLLPGECFQGVGWRTEEGLDQRRKY